MSVQLPDLTQKINDYFKIKSFSQLTQKQYVTVHKRLSDGIEKLKEEKTNALQVAMDGE